MLAIREQRHKIISIITDWESIERESSESIEKVKARGSNPLVRLVMDILANDARLHRRVQEFLLNSLEREPLTLSPDEVGDVIELIRDHARRKAQTVERVQNILGKTEDRSLGIQKFLLESLLVDEKKHEKLLERIKDVMQGPYPYWPH
jgi:hypothetical protein